MSWNGNGGPLVRIALGVRPPWVSWQPLRRIQQKVCHLLTRLEWLLPHAPEWVDSVLYAGQRSCQRPGCRRHRYEADEIICGTEEMAERARLITPNAKISVNERLGAWGWIAIAHKEPRR